MAPDRRRLLIRLMGFGLLKPKHRMLGADTAGRVEAAGRNVKQFQPGDEVFGDISESGLSGFAEVRVCREGALALKPAGTTCEEAAEMPMAAIDRMPPLNEVPEAIWYLEKGHVPGKVAITVRAAPGF